MLSPGSPVPPGQGKATMGVPSAPAQEAFSVLRESEAESRSLVGVDPNPIRPLLMCVGGTEHFGVPKSVLWGWCMSGLR